MPCVRYDRFSDPWLQLGGEQVRAVQLQDSKDSKDSKIPIHISEDL